MALAVLLASSMAASAASAAVTIASAEFSYDYFVPGAPQQDTVDLQPGSFSRSISEYALLCDQDCGDYRFGGATDQVTWVIDLSPSTLGYTYGSFQGSDDGGAALETYDLQVFFTAARELTIQPHDATSASSVICGDCQHSFHTNLATFQQDGAWYALIEISGDASVTDGDQTLAERFSASVTEVPEPAEWTLMSLGFGSLGLALRRRARGLSGA
jgi:hypothetical protein